MGLAPSCHQGNHSNKARHLLRFEVDHLAPRNRGYGYVFWVEYLPPLLLAICQQQFEGAKYTDLAAVAVMPCLHSAFEIQNVLWRIAIHGTIADHALDLAQAVLVLDQGSGREFFLRRGI